MVGENGPASAAERHVLLTLSLHTDVTGGSCFPSIRLLVRETRRSSRTLTAILRNAESSGWITRTARPTGGRGRPGWDYQLVIPNKVSDGKQNTGDAGESFSTGKQNEANMFPHASRFVFTGETEDVERTSSPEEERVNTHASARDESRCGCGDAVWLEEPDMGLCRDCSVKARWAERTPAGVH